jgi:maltose alpha-D-glucosyltransferase/alpha-amylase
MVKRRTPIARFAADPLWYKDAIIYEVHVRAFLDSNADGIGDFRGLTQKLDYLEDLGVTALWLLPFYPSPLKDDGYDIADYYSINPIYGTLKDFKHFLTEAHARRLRVITELVVNHTSDQHPWFQRSRTAPPGSAWRDFYVWSDSAEKYREARIIFRDFEPSNWTWDPVAHAYYWHRFYSHQPDLNFDNPQVHKELARVLDFWLDLGVDGLRLDAVPYLYEREGTSCENLPDTHTYLKTLRRHVDEKYGDRMLLAEANQWPEDAVTYFGAGKGDECHMAFHFPLMPRLFMAVRMEDRLPLVDILEQTPAIPETGQWALFLRNHDELTLEMVTDEERDYMYRVYANDAKARINLGIRRRLAPLLGNDRKRIELLNLLLFSLPGTPVLYYGDEIGIGDNVFLGDRNGVRTPMQWSSDKNAGFSRASPQALYLPITLDPEYHYEAVNVEAQQRNPNSLLWWMKQALTLRKRYRAFGRGSLRFLKPDNRKVLAFVRQYEQETILVVANLSRFPQPVRLDLHEFKQMVPVELFGRTPFPAIPDQPFLLTLSPHAAFWFALEPVATSAPAELAQRTVETLKVPGDWEEIFQDQWRNNLDNALTRFLKDRGWRAMTGRELRAAQIGDAIPVPLDSTHAYLLVLRLEDVEGEVEENLLPLALATGPAAEILERSAPQQIVARFQSETQPSAGVLYAANQDPELCHALFEAISRRRSFAGAQGELKGVASSAVRADAPEPAAAFALSFGYPEQSNLNVIFGGKFFLKLFRRVEAGINPDLEMQRFLTEKDFPNIKPLAGWLEYRRNSGEEFTVGMLTRFLPQAQDAWAYTQDVLSRYFDRVRTISPERQLEPGGDGSLLARAGQEVPEAVGGMLGTYLELARLLGQRTGELHLALTSDSQNRDFAPEPFTPFYQRALYQSVRNLTVQTVERLRRALDRLPEDVRPQAARVIALQPEILKRLRAVADTRIQARRIRGHGDCHLGQVLYTGKDFVFIDFEGESGRPMGERRIKRSPLRDVAAMLRSFDYVTRVALLTQVERGTLQREQLPQLEPWTTFWSRWVGAVYLRAYLKVVGPTDLLPHAKEALGVLLEADILEKALYETGYELTHRPNWLAIPLGAILELITPAGSPLTASGKPTA